MRGIIASVWTALAILASAGHAQPVVIELYTSQGCSSCPPADALMAELSMQGDVIPLALHVDYWDYIGWKDEHADPAFTLRQRSYAQAAGHRTIYTPQMIVDGQDHVVGYKPMRLAQLIQHHHEQGSSVDLSVSRDGGTLNIHAVSIARQSDDMVVALVRYMPEDTVEIRGGENAGKTITYYNIVTEWKVLGRWSGSEPLLMQAEVTGDYPVVVLLQKAGPGPILAAARVN